MLWVVVVTTQPGNLSFGGVAVAPLSCRANKKVVSMLTFGSLIREYRLKKNWTQVELATKLGIDQTTVSEWESDRRKHLSGIIYANLISTLGIPRKRLRELHTNKDTVVEAIETSMLSADSRRILIQIYKKLLTADQLFTSSDNTGE
jgi:transcriptional regulator with XRE-family HTH domain